jgi:hypothetical protein
MESVSSQGGDKPRPYNPGHHYDVIDYALGVVGGGGHLFIW